MLLSDAESNIAGCTTPQVTCGPRAVGDLVHAGTHLVRNSGDPASFSCLAIGDAVGKVNSHTPIVVGRKSDKPIVPEKRRTKQSDLWRRLWRKGV